MIGGKVLEARPHTDYLVNRRTFLASLPTVVLAGCATRLGLADRLEVAEKYVVAVELDDGDERERELARRRYRRDDPTPTYVGEVHDLLTADLGEESPLVVPDATSVELDREFLEVQYGIEACEVTDDEERSCQDVTLLFEDFNEIEVGDVVDLRLSDDGAGLVSVHQRRDERR